MPEAINLAAVFGLPPKDAIDYFARRGHTVVTTWDWREMWQEAHARAFTVARVSNLDVLKDIRESLRTALAEGQTMATWQKNLAPMLKARGWWGRREETNQDTGEIRPVTNPDTGEIRPVDLSAPWRLRTIFRTNVQTSMMAGHWQRFQENSANRPYWEYVAVMDLSTRPAHAALHGKVFRLDDPKAAKLWPPNDWGCRCRARARSEADLKRLGKVPADTEKYLTEREEDDPATGGTITRSYFKSPDMRRGFATGAGWNYNVGQAGFVPKLDQYSLEEARAFIGDSMQGPAFSRFIAGKRSGSVPVAALDDDLVAALGSKTRIVTFTPDSRDKNFHHHPELSPEDYLLLPAVLQQPTYVIRDRENAASFVKVDDKWWHAAMKIVEGREMFLLSFRRTNREAVSRLLKRGEVLRKPTE